MDVWPFIFLLASLLILLALAFALLDLADALHLGRGLTAQEASAA
jgi:hypothetical protein